MELGNQPTPYWPQSNALTDNFNKSLAKLVNISFFFQERTGKTNNINSYNSIVQLQPKLCSEKIRNKLPRFVYTQRGKQLRDRAIKHKLRMKRSTDKHSNRADIVN